MLPEWLQHAAQLLHHSYTAADFKIKQKDQPARVSDYRYYLVRSVSGLRLLKHLLTSRRFIVDGCMSMLGITKIRSRVLHPFGPISNHF